MAKDEIYIKGAREHNLKNVNLRLPHNKITVISGVSGSGKSSLAFDTLFAEGQRQYVESLSPYMRQFLGQRKVAQVDEIIGLAPAISIDQKALSHNPRSTVGTLTEIYDYWRVLFARLGEVYCPLCNRRLESLSADQILDIIVAQAKAKKAELVTIISPLVRGRKGEYYQLLYNYLSLGYSEVRVDGKFYALRDEIKLNPKVKHNIDLVVDRVELKDTSRLAESIELALEYSEGLLVYSLAKTSGTKKLESKEAETLLSAHWTCPYDNFSFPELEPRLFSFNSPTGACPQCGGLGRANFYTSEPCSLCKGQRLRQEALFVRLAGKNIVELSALSIKDGLSFFEKYYETLSTAERQVAETVVVEIISRLEFLVKVGLDYLSLNREAHTLSGGEAQRIRLSAQIGSQLSRTLYVLDEPTIGLHERDTDRLIATLEKLKAKNNTLVIVEHDEKTIEASDYLVDMGPLAGVHGGQVVASGNTKELLAKKPKTKFPLSLTLKYLRGEESLVVPSSRRKQNHGWLKIKGAKAFNLKNISVNIPLGRLVGLSGVSGSGKSTLMLDVLYENLKQIKARPGKVNKLKYAQEIKGSEYINRVVVIDQSPIGRTPRSNPATYTGIFTPIREFYAQLPLARERGYSLGRFSFNRAGGRCEACSGAGANLIEMHFLPPVLVECDQCQGKRFNRETLAVKHKGKNIADVLELTISEALGFFAGNYYITDKLEVLEKVGLGYLKLGQSATTLSGGEAQRVKIARELTHSLGKRTLYLLDEPTTGLHYYDIKMLLEVLNHLVSIGNSVLVIEHNLHVLKSVDYLIDLGPDGGEAGGRLVVAGTPEEVVAEPRSITGEYLKPYLV